MFRLGLTEPPSANLTPEGKRFELTGLFGQLTVQVVPRELLAEQVTEVKLFGPPTKPGGLGVDPHIMLASSTMSTEIATPDDARLCIAC